MTAQELRVTQVVFDLNGGGMETLVANMAQGWRGTDVRVSVITLSGRVGHVGETVRPIVDEFTVLRPRRLLSMIAPTKLVPAIRRTRPHVVHIHSGAWFKGAWAAALAGVPRIVFTEHGREHHDTPFMRLQDHVASRLTTTVVAVSERLRRYMIRAVGVRPDRIVTIPNGVDTHAFTPGAPSAALRARLRIPEDALVIGSVGRLEPVKAYVRLVEAYARLRTEEFGRPLVLVLFGDGSDRPAIEAAIDRLGVREGVRVPGWMDSPADAYRILDVFAMTSRSEGMSVSLMEAMACGVCPVVTSVGSNADVMGPGLADHVVPDFDAGALVTVLRGLLQSPDRRDRAGSAARAHAAEFHSVDRMLRDYQSLYLGKLALEEDPASLSAVRPVATTR